MGNDRLVGGTGIDTYRFGIGGGLDRIEEAEGEASVLALEPGILLSDLAADREGDDLALRRQGTDEGVILTGYYAQNHAWTLREAGGAEQSLASFLAGATGNSANTACFLEEEIRTAG